MIRLMALSILFMTIVCAGCWDRREINDLALVMASSLDLRDKGKYFGATQISIPARQIGNTPQKNKLYFSESGIGSSIQQIIQKEQPKLSRELFIAHRRVLFIGEKLAKNGIEDLLDHFARNPTTRFRTYILVVKGGEGKDALDTDYPMEFVPTEAVREMENIAGGTAVTIRDLLNNASVEGVQPVMGAISLKPRSDAEGGKNRSKQTFRLSNTAIFKDLKLKGYLDDVETQYLLWVTGKLKKGTLYAQFPEQEGAISVKIMQTERQITSRVKGKKVKFTIHLKGKGVVVENQTRLDFSNPNNIHRAEDALQQSVQKGVQKLIVDVQKKYESDIFGFGETIHKQNNKAWKKLKSQWSEAFAEAQVTVDVEFVVTRAGMSGPSPHLREQDVIK